MNKEEFEKLSIEMQITDKIDSFDFQRVKKAYSVIKDEIPKNKIVEIYWLEPELFKELVKLYTFQKQVIDKTKEI